MNGFIDDHHGGINMNKIYKPISFICALLVGVALACNLPSNTVTETPAPVTTPTEKVTESAPTESVVLSTATPEYAPFCDPNAVSGVSCEMPIARESSSFCTKKTPYNLLFTNKGVTFQSLTEGFTCSDAGVKDGQSMVTCTGPMASTFAVKVCDPSCGALLVQSSITQCPQDYYFDGAQGCCSTELQGTPQNCVVLKLKTTTCVVNCRDYSTKSACSKNSNACYWDELNSECVARK